MRFDEAYNELSDLLRIYDDTGDLVAWNRYRRRRLELSGMGGEASSAAERHEEQVEEAARMRSYW